MLFEHESRRRYHRIYRASYLHFQNDIFGNFTNTTVPNKRVLNHDELQLLSEHDHVTVNYDGNAARGDGGGEGDVFEITSRPCLIVLPSTNVEKSVSKKKNNAKSLL